MKYRVQVKVLNQITKTKEYRDVHPTNGPAYEYDTREEAERMLRMCYPSVMLDSPDDVRVIEVA